MDVNNERYINIEKKLKEIKGITDVFSYNIDNIINLIKNIKLSIEKFYIINDNIWNNYNVNKRNFETFKNANNINNIINNIIIKDIREITNKKDIKKI